MAVKVAMNCHGCVSPNCEEFREMQVVKCAKYVTLTVGRHLGINSFNVLKINAVKSLVERLCDLKICALSVLGYIGSVCAPDKATLNAEGHAQQCTTVGPYNAILTNLLGVGPVCVLGS